MLNDFYFLSYKSHIVIKTDTTSLYIYICTHGQGSSIDTLVLTDSNNVHSLALCGYWMLSRGFNEWYLLEMDDEREREPRKSMLSAQLDDDEYDDDGYDDFIYIYI